MQIRPVTLDDFAGLCRLWAEVDRLHARLLPGYFRPPPEPPRDRNLLRHQLADKDLLILVADEDSHLCALSEARLVDTPTQPQLVPRRRLYVDDLVVDPRWRRRGLGRALMDATAAWGKRHGAEEMLLTVWTGNEEAEAFYASLGFEPRSRVLGREL